MTTSKRQQRPPACRCRLRNSLPKPLLDMQGRTKATAAL